MKGWKSNPDSMPQPLISIITPCYNSADFIQETLDCIAQQDYENWEHFIIDDGSTDRTTEILKLHTKAVEKAKFFHRPSDMPKGANACRNYGADMAKGSHLIFLDADDLLSKDALSEMAKLIQNRSFKMLVSTTRPFAKSIEDTPFKKLEINGLKEAHTAFSNYNILWSTVSVLWEKAFFNELGEFDLKLNRFQDYDIHLRALSSMNEDDVVFFPTNKPLCYYRNSAYHLSINRTKMRIILNDAKYLINKHLQKQPENIDAGFIQYLLRRYNLVFKKEDYAFFEQLKTDHQLVSSAQLLKLSLLKPFKFHFFTNKVLSYLLYRVL